MSSSLTRDGLGTFGVSWGPAEKATGTLMTGEGRMSKNDPDGMILHGPALALKTNPRCGASPILQGHLGSGCSPLCPCTTDRPSLPVRVVWGSKAWFIKEGCKQKVGRDQRQCQVPGDPLRLGQARRGSKPACPTERLLLWSVPPTQHMKTSCKPRPWLVLEGLGAAALALSKPDQIVWGH